MKLWGHIWTLSMAQTVSTFGSSPDIHLRFCGLLSSKDFPKDHPLASWTEEQGGAFLSFYRRFHFLLEPVVFTIPFGRTWAQDSTFLNSSLPCFKILPYMSVINQTLKWERRKEDRHFQLGIKQQRFKKILPSQKTLPNKEAKRKLTWEECGKAQLGGRRRHCVVTCPVTSLEGKECTRRDYYGRRAL